MINPIPHQAHLRSLPRLLRENSVVTMLGARKIGNTALARSLIRGRHRLGFEFKRIDSPRPAEEHS